MYVMFPPQRSVILEYPDLFPVELVDAGVGVILDETGNPILDTNNRVLLDQT